MKTQLTQTNFCRLSGMSSDKYQALLFETGCEFAEWFWGASQSKNSKRLAGIILSLPQYWNWWANLWNIRTQSAFGVCAISETETYIEPTTLEALREAFNESHSLLSFAFNVPNQWVLRALTDKITPHDIKPRADNQPQGKRATNTSIRRFGKTIKP